VLVAFSLGYPYSLGAAAGGVLLLLIGGVRTETILEGVDWTLLLFFSGLFVVMHGVEVSGLSGAMIQRAGDLAGLSPTGQIARLSAVSAILSNLVSNVPAVMLLKPLVPSLGNSNILWLVLAMSSTLAGNLTLIGSVANLIVVQQARKHIDIGFMEYFRVGALITALTIAIGIGIFAIEVRIAAGAEAAGDDTFQKRPRIVTVQSSDARSVQRALNVVLLCDTAEARIQGLQGFRPLKKNEAALFVFEKDEPVTFWMATVDYPIDIIFIGPDSKVVRSYPNCMPGSQERYPSLSPVRWVVETAAGSDIHIGDTISIKAAQVP